MKGKEHAYSVAWLAFVVGVCRSRGNRALGQGLQLRLHSCRPLHVSHSWVTNLLEGVEYSRGIFNGGIAGEISIRRLP